MKNLITTLSLSLILFFIFTKETKAQIFAGNDTSICAGTSITLNATTSSINSTNTYFYDTVPYAPETYGGTPVPFPGTYWDDVVSSQIQIPFEFCFFGQVFTSCYVGSNGWLSFSPGQPITFTACILPNSGVSVPKNCIMGPWADWNPSYGVGPYVFYYVTGVSPNRKFVVNWDNCPMHACTSNLGKFQIVLCEGSNEIYNHITNKPICTQWSVASTQGIHNFNGTLAYWVPGRNGNQWSAQYESSKFKPIGTISLPQIQWYDTYGNIISNGSSITVNPISTTSYIAGVICSCSGFFIDTVTISIDSTSLSIDYVNTENVDCNGGNTGSIELAANGCVSPFSFLWNTGDTTEYISNLGAGNYFVTISDSGNNVVVDSMTITEPSEIETYSNISNVLITGTTNGSIDLTISGGVQPYSHIWSNGETSEDVYNLSAGLYYVTVIDNNSCTNIEMFEITEPLNSYPPDWPYTVSSTNHTILIPDTAIITMNNTPIDVGDFIGVFYDSLGTLACGGYTIWQNNTTSIAAWGAEVGLNNGFAIGEEFKWKIWDISESTEYEVDATYMPVPPMTDQEFFAINGMSGLTSLFNLSFSSSQQIVLPPGWSFFSTNIIPSEELFDSIFANNVSNVVIVKNYLGQIYWPAYGINFIGNLSIHEGYQISMTNPDILTITGLSIQPENENCNVPSGWSFIPYLRSDPASIVDMLSNISNDIEIVKNYLGLIYWPNYGINTIGNMIPGEGYQIKMNNSNILTYPPNSANISKSNIQIPQPKQFKTTINTGSNMTLGIPKAAWETEPPIDSEIGIYSSEGLLVGSSVFTSENLAISIWGNDELTKKIDGLLENEKFIVKVWNGTNEETLEIENWLQGDELYITNKISIVEKLSTFEIQHSTFQLFQNVPNPFSETTEISFYAPHKAFVEIELFNLLGERIETIHSQNYTAGNHTIIFDRKHLSAGTYFYRLNSGDFSETRIMSVGE